MLNIIDDWMYERVFDPMVTHLSKWGINKKALSVAFFAVSTIGFAFDAFNVVAVFVCCYFIGKILSNAYSTSYRRIPMMIAMRVLLITLVPAFACLMLRFGWISVVRDIISNTSFAAGFYVIGSDVPPNKRDWINTLRHKWSSFWTWLPVHAPNPA